MAAPTLSTARLLLRPWQASDSAIDSWGHGYATEGAIAALRHGFEQAGLEEIVSFTAKLNLPSQAVMRRAGLRDSGQDFEHPALPEGHALRPHGLYKAARLTWRAG